MGAGIGLLVLFGSIFILAILAWALHFVIRNSAMALLAAYWIIAVVLSSIGLSSGDWEAVGVLLFVLGVTAALAVAGVVILSRLRRKDQNQAARGFDVAPV